MSVVILTGASGAGKSTITKQIAAAYPNVTCLYFDSIGVPSTEEMISEYGSPEGWQRAMTNEWIRRIKNDYKNSDSILFEGQARISFIEEALKLHELRSASVVLIDCNDVVRSHRLIQNRAQPELANEQMMNWARYLRNEASRAGYRVFDTSDQDIATSVLQVRSLLGC